MSFLFVLAFFAVFGIIILTQVRQTMYISIAGPGSNCILSQVFVVDERNRQGTGNVRRSGITNRFGESIPDYDEVQVRMLILNAP